MRRAGEEPALSEDRRILKDRAPIARAHGPSQPHFADGFRT